MLKLARLTVVPLLLVPSFGCKSEEKEPAPPATDYFGVISSDLDAMQTELKDGVYQIDSVTKSLNQFAAAQGDLRKPLSSLQKSVDDLDTTSARIKDLGKELDAKEAAFQSSWAEEMKSIESANVRRTAEQGRTNVDAAFRTLDQESAAIGNLFREWESKVKQIESSLAADLSPANQQALASKIREVSDLAPQLKERIQAFSNNLRKLSGTMTAL